MRSERAIPLFIPAIPFALVLGVAITESAMPTAVAWSTNLFIFAGASQLATVSLAATATWLTLVATAAVINLRHVMYSAALSPRFNDQPNWFRWVGPFFLIDQLFAFVQRASRAVGDRVATLLSHRRDLLLRLVDAHGHPRHVRRIGDSNSVATRRCAGDHVRRAGRPRPHEPTRHRRRDHRRRRVPACTRRPEQRRHPPRGDQRGDRRVPRRSRPESPAITSRATIDREPRRRVSAVLAIGLITYTSRAGLIVFLADRPLPANITRALRYVGPAVLSALTINLIAGGKGASGVEAAEVAAIVAAMVVAWTTRNLIAALGAGMVTLWVIGYVV